MNILSMQNKGLILDNQPELSKFCNAKPDQKHQVKIDVKKVLMSQNKLTSTIIV